ncbi:low temperature requirement protein A [Mycobacterium sp. M23085]|uniref:low temperature requirement protein A n=1 Tax=Mycobacterium sp. M23085 TaxID=3378087 RepID=UPI0038778F25
MIDRASPDQRTAYHEDRTVGTLELFFDLVYVYAMSEVTTLMLANVSWTGFGQGALALAAIWWAWENYAWLTNTFEHADPTARILIYFAMAAMLIAATALPNAFGKMALVFATAYVFVRLLHVVLLVRATRGDEELRTPTLQLVPYLLFGSGLIVVGAFMTSPSRELLWLVSATVDLSGPLIAGRAGWRVSPRYFVERHGLIVIIALGESIVRAGGGAKDSIGRPLTAVAVLTAVLIAAGMWWTYFEPSPLAAARLRRLSPARRARHARDAYSYLHLVLVTGIVFFALGVYEAVGHPDERMAPLPGVALSGGVALFYLGDVAYRWRDHRRIMVDRLVAGGVMAATVPLTVRLPALTTLTVLLLVSALRVIWEIRGGNDPPRVPLGWRLRPGPAGIRTGGGSRAATWAVRHDSPGLASRWRHAGPGGRRRRRRGRSDPDHVAGQGNP